MMDRCSMVIKHSYSDMLSQFVSLNIPASLSVSSAG